MADLPGIGVHNGRVTSRDPSGLGEGELAIAQDCYYKPANPSLWSIGGRSAFNSSAESAAIKSGAFLEFDDATAAALIIAMRSTSYRKATAGTTGAFSDLAGFDGSDYSLAGTATTLDTAHYNDQHILANGVDRPRVVSDDATQMFLGMQEAAAPTLDRDSGAGVGFILTSGKTIVYWIEERVKVAGVVVKRSTGARVTLTGDGTTDKPRLTRGALSNPDTTHWALFGTATNFAYPTGGEIAETDAATTFLDDSRTGTDPGIPGGGAFESVSATIAGVTFNDAKYGPAPIGDTLDVFEDSIISNDVNAPGDIAFSFTDNIHAWPSFYRIKFNTKHHDRVVAVRAMDNFLLVLLHNSVWRVNTLPKTSDPSFQPERTKAIIHGAHGAVNARAVALFSFGDGIRCAYVSHSGILVTDGNTWSTLSDDMDWFAEVDTSQLSKCRLLNNPTMFRLEFTYVPIGGTRATKTAFLHYHPSHAKESVAGGLRAKMLWPINRDANDAFLVSLNGIDEVYSANEDGRIYRHDTGFTEPTGVGGLKMRVQTREEYPIGVAGHATLRDLWTHHQAAAGQSATVRIVQRNSGEGETQGGASIPLDFREATPCGRQGFAESFQFEFEISNPTATIGLDYFVPDYDIAGKSEEA